MCAKKGTCWMMKSTGRHLYNFSKNLRIGCPSFPSWERELYIPIAYDHHILHKFVSYSKIMFVHFLRYVPKHKYYLLHLCNSQNKGIT